MEIPGVEAKPKRKWNLTDETKTKMSKARKELLKDPEERRKVSERLKVAWENRENNGFGKMKPRSPLTEKTKRKMSEGHYKYWQKLREQGIVAKRVLVFRGGEEIKK